VELTDEAEQMDAALGAVDSMSTEELKALVKGN
jgi:hypothetical protein